MTEYDLILFGEPEQRQNGEVVYELDDYKRTYRFDARPKFIDFGTPTSLQVNTGTTVVTIPYSGHSYSTGTTTNITFTSAQVPMVPATVTFTSTPMTITGTLRFYNT